MARADKRDNPALDRFAELLSLDIAVNDIASRMGITKGYAYCLKAKLERMYGGEPA